MVGSKAEAKTASVGGVRNKSVRLPMVQLPRVEPGPGPRCERLLNSHCLIVDLRPQVSKMTYSPSALSHNNFRVDGLQFDPGVVDLKLPIDSALTGIAA